MSNAQQINIEVINGVTFLSTNYRGTTYTINYCNVDKEYTVHSRRNALSNSTGTYKFFDTLEDVANNVKAFNNIEAVKEMLVPVKKTVKAQHLRIKLYETKTLKEISEMTTKVMNDPESRVGARGIYLFNAKALKLLDEYSWAVYYLMGGNGSRRTKAQ